MSVTIARVYIGTEYSMLSMIVNSIRYSGNILERRYLCNGPVMRYL